MIEVEGPDGVIYEFPEGTDEATMRAAMQQVYGGPAPDQSPEMAAGLSELSQMTVNPTRAFWEEQDPGAVVSALSGASQGASLGFADEWIGARAAEANFAKDLFTGNWSGMYDRSMDTRGDVMDATRQLHANAREARPWTTGTGEVVGGLIPAMTGFGNLGKAATLPGKIGLGAASGGMTGGVYGFGSGEGGVRNRIEGATAGGIGGLLIGGAVPIAGHYAQKGVEAIANSRAVKSAIAAAPSPSDLKAIASALYGQADQVTNLPRADFAATVPGMLDDAARSGMDDMLTPGAARVAGKLDDAAQAVDPNIGFRELDILRKQAGIPAGNFANRTEQSIGSKMIAGIDDFIDTVDPQLSGVVKEARDMWGQLRRSELIEKAIEKAPNAASGFENGLRIEFRKIVNNPKLLRGFNEQEIAAIKAVAQGSTMGNLMRQIGRIGIGLSGQSNGLGATVGGIAGTAFGGPIGGLASVAAGTGAKAFTERATRKAAERALGIVGSREALKALPQLTYPGIAAALGVGGRAVLPQASEPLGRLLLER